MDDCLIITEDRIVVYGCSFVVSELKAHKLKTDLLDVTFYRIFIDGKYIWFWSDFRKVGNQKLVDELEQKFLQKLRIRHQQIYSRATSKPTPELTEEQMKENINRINRVYSVNAEKPKKRNLLQRFFDSLFN